MIPHATFSAVLTAVLLVPSTSLVAAIPHPDMGIKIVGGENSKVGEFPYIVSVAFGGSHTCGGVLIDSKNVITAAHCITGTDPVQLKIRAGSVEWAKGGTQVGVKKIIQHPAFTRNKGLKRDDDIAVLQLDKEVAKSSAIGYATLPKENSDPAAKTKVTVAGWGRTSEGGPVASKLNDVTLNIIDRSSCKTLLHRRDLELHDPPGDPEVQENMICAGIDAGGKDACQGDSGGPLVDSSKTLVGLVSWGTGCARPKLPGVYTRVSKYIKFINDNKAK